MAYSALCNATKLFPGLDGCLKTRTPNYLVICYNKTLSRDRGLWQVANSLDTSLPLFVLQLVTILVINRILMVSFRPLGLPRISAEILVINCFINISILFFGINLIIIILAERSNSGSIFYRFNKNRNHLSISFQKHVDIGDNRKPEPNILHVSSGIRGGYKTGNASWQKASEHSTR